MKNRAKGTEGRKALTLAFSFSPEQVEKFERRVEQLRPTVSNKSHYFQRLLELEIAENLLGRKPFERAGHRAGQSQLLVAA